MGRRWLHGVVGLWVWACTPGVPNAVHTEQDATPLRQVALGLCEDYPEETRSMAEVRRDLELLRQLGVGVLRVSIGWDAVEPEKDRYDFGFWDEFVALATREFGIELIVYVAYTPSWNSDGGPDDFWKTPPRDNAEFGELMGLLVERYGRDVHYWELWNEPDNQDYWLGTAAQYAALLKVGSTAVRQADPGARVIFGGLASRVEFLRTVFDEHGGSHFVDVVNLHSYFETWHPEPLETLPEYIGQVRHIVARHGGHQPLWMAEVGYSNYRSPEAMPPLLDFEHTETFQSTMLMRTMALLHAETAVELVAWYELKDVRAVDAVIGDAHNRHLGVVRADYTPKPAMDALKFTRSLFGEGFYVADAVRPLQDVPPDVVWRSFVTARGDLVVIAWRAPAGLLSGAEPLRLVAPYTRRGEPRAYDARGRSSSAPVRALPREGGSLLEFPVPPGDVVVVRLPVRAR